MTQKLLSIKYQEEKKSNKITNNAGVFPLLEFIKKMGIFKFADNTLKVRNGDQGWLDSQHFLSLFLINLIGGDCISDVDVLESDEGLKTAISFIEKDIVNINKKAIAKRFRRGRERVFPSDNALHNYALCFHNESEEQKRDAFRLAKAAFIPESNDNFNRLKKLFGVISNFSQINNPVQIATIDIDATITNTTKQSAFYTYQKSKGFQPVNAYWNEQKTILYSEFRDGNVNACYNLDKFFKESLSYLPGNISKRYLRSDSAGYNFELMEYCDKNKIGFSISAKLCKSMREEISLIKDKEWSRLNPTRDQLLKNKNRRSDFYWEWAEIPHIPDNPKSSDYRYIAVRSIIPNQKVLFEELENEAEDNKKESSQKQYTKDGKRYRIRVIVTNRKDMEEEDLFHWHNKRCGVSEQLHDVMKNELSGGQFPSNKFGVNAFWWLMMIYSLNILQLYKNLILENCWRSRRMKAFRLHFIYLAGRVLNRSRYLFIYLRNNNLFKNIIEKIGNLKWVPT